MSQPYIEATSFVATSSDTPVSNIPVYIGVVNPASPSHKSIVISHLSSEDGTLISSENGNPGLQTDVTYNSFIQGEWNEDSNYIPGGGYLSDNS